MEIREGWDDKAVSKVRVHVAPLDERSRYIKGGGNLSFTLYAKEGETISVAGVLKKLRLAFREGGMPDWVKPCNADVDLALGLLRELNDGHEPYALAVHPVARWLAKAREEGRAEAANNAAQKSVDTPGEGA